MKNLMKTKDYVFSIDHEFEKDLLYAFSKFLESKDKLVFIATHPKFEYDGTVHFIKVRKIDYAKDPISCFEYFLGKESKFNTIALYDAFYSFYPLQPDVIHTSFMIKYEIIN